MSTRNLVQEERNQIIILHGQGLNISQIAEELNLQVSYVLLYLHRLINGLIVLIEYFLFSMYTKIQSTIYCKLQSTSNQMN